MPGRKNGPKKCNWRRRHWRSIRISLAPLSDGDSSLQECWAARLEKELDRAVELNPNLDLL